jgi:hypothetical protein
MTRVVGPRDGVAGFLGSIGVRFLVDPQSVPGLVDRFGLLFPGVPV